MINQITNPPILISFREQINHSLSAQDKRIAVFAIVLFSALTIAAIYLFSRCFKSKPTQKKMQQAGPIQIKQGQNPKDQLEILLGKTNQAMISQIQAINDPIDSAKFFISISTQSKEVRNQYLENKFDTSNLSKQIDRMMKDAKASIELEGASELSISWEVYLKDKEGNFHHVTDEDKRKITKNQIKNYLDVSTIGVAASGKVLDDQLNFMPAHHDKFTRSR